MKISELLESQPELYIEKPDYVTLENVRIHVGEVEEEEPPLQNQTHSVTCETCQKAINISGNPVSTFRQCKWSGAVVSKHQACCERYKTS